MYNKSFVDIYIKNNFSFEEAKSEIDFAIETLYNFTFKDFVLGKSLDEQQIYKLEKIFKTRVETHQPIQQIIGRANFYNRHFFVNKYTLIPRPETELLVLKVLEYLKNLTNPKILDIGTGTGCIPITLVLENADITVDAIDISQEALETAIKNALFHNVYNRVKFFKSDLFNNVHSKYDIIISNPPYIPLKDKNSLQTEVKYFEPDTALFTNDEYGIEFYKKIITQSKNYLSPNGYIFFEIGVKQCKLIKDIANANRLRVIEVNKDFNSIDRILILKNDIDYHFSFC